MAGASTRWRGMEPKRSSAASQPPRLPGVAQDLGPPARSSSVARAGSAAAGARPMKSSTCRSRSRARETSISPIPAALDMKGSTTLRVEATATAASTALPPSMSTRMPAIEASGWAEATAPRAPMTTGR